MKEMMERMKKEGEERHLSCTTESSGPVLWTVLFNPMVFECNYSTISVHKTRKGAVKAMTKLKAREFYNRQWWDERFDEELVDFKYGKLEVQE